VSPAQLRALPPTAKTPTATVLVAATQG
jgi:hypothetical protein